MTAPSIDDRFQSVFSDFLDVYFINYWSKHTLRVKSEAVTIKRIVFVCSDGLPSSVPRHNVSGEQCGGLVAAHRTKLSPALPSAWRRGLAEVGWL